MEIFQIKPYFFELVLFSLLFLSNCNQQTMDTPPESTDRVAAARQAKEADLRKKLDKIGVDWEKALLYLRAFKQEQILEVWVKNDGEKGFEKLLTYPFCKTSGDLGPKRKEGDRQIPEGLYYINRFNPKSKFHLSLGLDYPNASDKIRGHPSRPGSDIFIHGKCATVGCIPITDDKIKELYILAQQVKSNGQANIRVDIFPGKLTGENMKTLIKSSPSHQMLWRELQPFFHYFETHKEVPRFEINASGHYAGVT